jgi:hypothetical protein
MNQSPTVGAAVRPSLGTMARRDLWPTPRVTATRTSRVAATAVWSRSAPSLEQAVELTEGMLPREIDSLEEVPESWGRLWPTPTANDWKNAGYQKGKDGATFPTLPGAVGAAKRWPTPMARDWRSGRASDATMERNARPLNEVVDRWPTPIARDAHSFKGAERSPNAEGAEPLSAVVGGQLNPTWVEWLMGFPLGWTDLGPSATPSSPKSPSGSEGEF